MNSKYICALRQEVEMVDNVDIFDHRYLNLKLLREL